MIVSSSKGTWAYAYMRSIADLYVLFALANWGANGSIGHDSNVWFVHEFKCLASKTILIVSPLGIMINGFKNVVPIFCFSSGVDPICFINIVFF